MRFTRTLCLGILAVAMAAPSFAQTNPAAATAQFGKFSSVVARTAETAPGNLYTFKAAPEVRSIGQLLGYIADPR